jgi:integrase
MVHGQERWQARISVDGVRRSRVCSSYREAKNVERELATVCQEQAEQGELAGKAPATTQQLLDYYVLDLERRGKAPDTLVRAKTTARAIETMTPDLWTLPISKVTSLDVYDFRQARLRDQAKPSTINRDLRTLRAALKQARPDFKFPGAAFLPEDETRVRWLRPEEELLVFDTMPKPFGAMSRLAALTLMRQGELRMLRREYVHLDQGVVMLPKAKGGARPVILSVEAQQILHRQLERHESEWVFPSPKGWPYSRVHVSRVFREASRGAGLRDFHFHDLRHHGATMALNQNYSAPIVQALGGWKTERMMKRYAAVTDTTLRAAAEAISGNSSWQQKRGTRRIPAKHAPIPQFAGSRRQPSQG